MGPAVIQEGLISHFPGAFSTSDAGLGKKTAGSRLFSRSLLVTLHGFSLPPVVFLLRVCYPCRVGREGAVQKAGLSCWADNGQRGT